MKIDLHNIKIKDLWNDYTNNGEDGVFAYSNKLIVRPQYQREFIYKPEQQENVIKSILHQYPLNVMYWVVNQNNEFELLDGQQRTISICNYIDGVFAININGKDKYFNSLSDEEKNTILNYELQVYFCEGTDKEKIEWFQIINTGTAVLEQQEINNAIYSGTWVTEAKKYFSKTGCAAFKLGNKYLEGSPIRQKYLETIIKWKSKGEITKYMSKHQNDKKANDLIDYFNAIIKWINTTFECRKEMNGLNWGDFYDKHHNDKLNKSSLEDKIKKLMEDEEIENKKGIYAYILSDDEKYLQLRKFSDSMKRSMYEKQNGICPYCKEKGNNKVYSYEEMEGDHIIPWSKGGKTEYSNLQMLCKLHNKKKNNL